MDLSDAEEIKSIGLVIECRGKKKFTLLLIYAVIDGIDSSVQQDGYFFNFTNIYCAHTMF